MECTVPEEEEEEETNTQDDWSTEEESSIFFNNWTNQYGPFFPHQAKHLLSEHLSKGNLTHFWPTLKMVAGNGLCQTGKRMFTVTSTYKVLKKPFSSEAKRAGLH